MATFNTMNAEPPSKRESVAAVIDNQLQLTAQAMGVPLPCVHLMAVLVDEPALFNSRMSSQIFDIMDADGGGEIDIAELREGTRAGPVQKFFMSIDDPVSKQLLSDDDSEFDLGMKTFDAGAGGTISKTEWGSFIGKLAVRSPLTSRHATPRHATPRHATPRHATRRP